MYDKTRFFTAVDSTDICREAFLAATAIPVIFSVIVI
jgi:hypothetical protein